MRKPPRGRQPLRTASSPRHRGRLAALCFLCVLSSASACFLPWTGGSEERIHLTTAEAPAVRADAALAYRVIVAPSLADRPSRVLVVRVRIDSFESGTLLFNPARVTLTLPGDIRARVLDRQRAAALLDRTQPGAGHLSYLHRPRSRRPRGGLTRSERKLIKRRLKTKLLGVSALHRNRPLVGYLVVDTRVPVSSLQGAILNVVVHRATDRRPVRTSFRFPRPSARGAGG